jgi:flagellar protein FliO/FliZ
MRLPPFSHGVAAALLGFWLLLLTAPASLAANGEDTPIDVNDAPVQVAETAGSGGSPILRTILGLAIVVAVIYGVAWLLRSVKRAREAQASGSGLHSLATLPLGPSRSLHLVRAGGEVVLIGVGEGGVTPIRTYEEDEARALGLIPHEDAAVPEPVGLPGLPGPRPSGRLGRLLDEVRRRTVIK